MGYDLHRATYEAALAAAHRALNRAIGAAEAMGDDGAQNDLEYLQAHITKMGDDSISGRRTRKHGPHTVSGQLRLR